MSLCALWVFSSIRYLVVLASISADAVEIKARNDDDDDDDEEDGEDEQSLIIGGVAPSWLLFFSFS